MCFPKCIGYRVLWFLSYSFTLFLPLWCTVKLLYVKNGLLKDARIQYCTPPYFHTLFRTQLLTCIWNNETLAFRNIICFLCLFGHTITCPVIQFKKHSRKTEFCHIYDLKHLKSNKVETAGSQFSNMYA